MFFTTKRCSCEVKQTHFCLFDMPHILNIENVAVLYRYCKRIFMETITWDSSIIQITTHHNLPSNIF